MSTRRVNEDEMSGVVLRREGCMWYEERDPYDGCSLGQGIRAKKVHMYSKVVETRGVLNNDMAWNIVHPHSSTFIIIITREK